MELALGTAKFEKNYGLHTEELSKEVCVSIFDHAYQQGIKHIDTAPTYGNAERLIGISNWKDWFEVTTKIAKVDKPKITNRDIIEIRSEFLRSLTRLRVNRVYGLLVHNPDDLIADCGERVWDWMKLVKQNCMVEKIGVSVYSPGQIDKILKKFEIDIIQVPLNILDQRLIQNGYLKNIKSLGIEIHCRSIFLKGLLLKPIEKLPSFFDPIKKTLSDFKIYLLEKRIDALAACLDFAKHIQEINKIIIGISNPSQLSEIARIYKSNYGSLDYLQFSINDENIINPMKWNAA